MLDEFCKGVTLVSDITNAAGSRIQQDMFDDGLPITRHKGLMPYQDNPNRSSWNLWRNFLRRICSHELFLSKKLGRWLASGESLH